MEMSVYDGFTMMINILKIKHKNPNYYEKQCD